LRIAGSHFLPFDCHKTYRSLHDPALSIRCLPDFERLERLEEDHYAVTIRLSFATLSAVFTGTIKIVDPQPPTSFKILVEGDVMFGFVKGEGLMQLKPFNDGTALTYDGDVQVAGAIAALGQRVIDTTAKAMIRKFFDKFIDEVNKQP
jgi:carbon monoxide dehydrogenase subunit G